MINSKTQLYGIFGSPVAHSLSPIIHNHCFQSNNLNAVYLAFEVSNIEKAFNAARELNIQGLSITIPHKILAMDQCDHIDSLAREIGSINTIVNENGYLKGYNTDGYGACLSLIDKKIPVQNKRILILGNGGSARAIAFTLKKENSIPIICGRNADKARALAEDTGTGEYITFSELSNTFMKKIDIIINTTPIGMNPHSEISPLNKSLLMTSHTVFDIIYSPHTTTLLKDAAHTGCTIIHGINMLINQAVKQFELWTQCTPSADELFEVLQKHLK